MKLLLALCLISVTVTCSPVPSQNKDITVDDTVKYLARNGYLALDKLPHPRAHHRHQSVPYDLHRTTKGKTKSRKQQTINPDDPMVQSALKALQKNTGLKQTGILDEATKKLMRSPRCALPDIAPPRQKKPSWKRYRPKRHSQTNSVKWGHQPITYYVKNVSRSLEMADMEGAMKKALSLWGQYGHLRFKKRNNARDADIEVSFVKGHHGNEEKNAFPEGSSTLAHAFFPCDSKICGDIHFNDAFDWVVKATDAQNVHGVDLFSVTLHELGHSLGLDHAKEHPQAVMFPYFKEHKTLHCHDIYAIRKLYAEDFDEQRERRNLKVCQAKSRTTTTEQPTIPTEPTTTTEIQITDNPKHNADRICNGSFDTIATVRELFIFNEGSMWRFNGTGNVMNGYPATIKSHFPELPDKIDAFYEPYYGKSRLVFFSGNQYWVYNNFQELAEGPNSISDYDLPVDVDHVDAVINSPTDLNTTYLFSGNYFWTFDETTRKRQPEEPSFIKDYYPGITGDVDSVMSWEGKTYFFKGNEFWTFHRGNLLSHSKRAAQYWLRSVCPDEETDINESSRNQEYEASYDQSNQSDYDQSNQSDYDQSNQSDYDQSNQSDYDQSNQSDYDQSNSI